MNHPDHHRHIQLDGPFGRPASTAPDGAFPFRGPIGRNLGLMGLLALPLIAALFPRDPCPGTSWGWPLALAGGLCGVLVFSPRRSRTLMKLDWAAASLLTGMMIAAPHGGRQLEFLMALAGGLICGFSVSRPRAAYFLARPGLIPWLAITVTALAAHIFHPGSNGARPAVIFGCFNWPMLCALVAAGFCFAGGRTSVLYWALPWLAAISGFFFNIPQDSLFINQPISRAAALTLPAFFIAPQMARSRLELLIYEAVLLLMLFCLPPFEAWFFDPALPCSGLIFLPRWLLDRQRRKQRPEAAEPQALPTFAGRRARLKCGHQGAAPYLAEWRGLPGCRLAAQNDGGPLLCPYGCLGLGDCVRHCPAEAISLKNGFPVIDPGRCRGCGRCESVCPKQLFELNDGEIRAFIPCAARSGLKNNANYCAKSCLGCGKCRKACPAKAIGRAGDFGAMSVDQAACLAYGPSCGQACRAACPRRIIQESREGERI